METPTKVTRGTPIRQLLNRLCLAGRCPGCGETLGVDVEDSADQTTATVWCRCGTKVELRQEATT